LTQSADWWKTDDGDKEQEKATLKQRIIQSALSVKAPVSAWRSSLTSHIVDAARDTRRV